MRDTGSVINVDLDKIVTAKGLQDHLSGILFDVEEKEKVYIVTKGGKPRAALVNVDYLMELTGQKVDTTEEYDRYDQIKEESAPETPAAVDTTPLAQVDKINLQDEVAEPSLPTTPVEPAPAPLEATLPVPESPIPESLKELDSFSAPLADADPYAVTDEPPTQNAVTGLPAPAEPVAPATPPVLPQAPI